MTILKAEWHYGNDRKVYEYQADTLIEAYDAWLNEMSALFLAPKSVEIEESILQELETTGLSDSWSWFKLSIVNS